MSTLEEHLYRWFGFRSFRHGQRFVIESLLNGRDAVVVMPTGSGKSLCFQLPALLLEGTTVVVSPLIALMKDQVDALEARRIPATFLNSSLTSDETTRRLNLLRRGHYRLVYVAPERFRNPRFRAAFHETPLAMLAIDEAHCISAWGHDFRPDYLHLGEIIAKLPPTVRLLAVTATATDTVRKDIAEHLRLGQNGRPHPELIVTGFERPNLALNVTRVRTHKEKLEQLLQIIEFFRTGIVYCATRKMVERVQALLAGHGIKAVAYNGAMDDAERTAVQDAFMHGRAPIVVATNAFGMGVDRRDIRFVVHWDVPGSLEAYYQEVGRAGRDGAYAWCELFFNYADVRTQEFFIESANPPAEHVYEFYATVRNACAHGENGEVTLSPEAWAAQAGMKSPLTIRNLAALFERHGLLSRTRKIGSPYSTITVPESYDPALLKQICAGLAQKEAADRERLRELLDYIGTRRCRHRFMLAYFGEQCHEKPCTKCDICHPLSAFPPRLMPDEQRLTDVRKILSCIARLHEDGDYALVADILRGEAPAPWHKQTTYGLLRSAQPESILQTCEALEMDGYIAGMRLTPAGYDLVLGKKEVSPIAVFHTGRTHALSKPNALIPTHGLATALRKWVNEEAARRMLPTYMVLNQETIAALSKKRPATFEELELVPGMGKQRIAKYGEALLELIRPYL